MASLVMGNGSEILFLPIPRWQEGPASRLLGWVDGVFKTVHRPRLYDMAGYARVNAPENITGIAGNRPPFQSGGGVLPDRDPETDGRIGGLSVPHLPFA